MIAAFVGMTGDSVLLLATITGKALHNKSNLLIAMLSLVDLLANCAHALVRQMTIDRFEEIAD